MPCWAAPLSKCDGAITDEHLISESLFGKRIRVDSHNASWLGAPSVELPIRKLTANILCRGHNNELGRTADAGALRLLRALRQSHTPNTLPGATGPRPPVDRRISGLNLGRWLCKTHCNLLIVNGLVPNPDYAKYAFLQATEVPLHFYLVGGVGDSVRFADPRDAVVRYAQLIADDDSKYDGFTISVGGLVTLVSTLEVQRGGTSLLDRVAGLEFPTPLGPYWIRLDWSGEPSVA